MPITKVGSTVTETAPSNFDQFFRTGVMHNGDFAVCDVRDVLKQIQFDPSALPTNTTVTIAAGASTSGTITLPNIANPTLAAVGGAGALQVDVPTEAGTATIAAGITKEVMLPAAGLTTFTLVFPTTPPNGFSVRYSSTQAITNLVLTGGGSDTFQNATTGVLANGFAEFVYRTSTTKWYRIG